MDVKKTVLELLDRPEANLTDALDDLGIDSLQRTEVVMGLEDKFKVKIPDKDAEKFHTVGDIVTYIESKK